MYKVGQLVYLKSADELVAKYGCNQFGIPTPHISVLSGMVKFCGKEYVIQYISPAGHYKLKNAGQYLWTEEMLEPINKQDPEDIRDWLTVFEA